MVQGRLRWSWGWSKRAQAYIPNDWTFAEVQNGLGYNTKEQTTMENKVTVIDPAEPKVPVFRDLQTGEIFRFANGQDKSVYIRTDEAWTCVYLKTGRIYRSIAPDREIVRVKQVNLLSMAA